MPNVPGSSRTAINEGDRQLRRTCVRFGEEMRELRLRADISQASLARAIGVSRSVICLMEQGSVTTSPRIRARAVVALGGDFRIAVFPGRGPMIHDAAHAAIIEALLRLCHRAWRPSVEAPVPGSARRSSDLRLDGREAVVLIEVETHVRALESIIRECAEKRAAVAGSDHRRRPVHVVLVLPPTRHHRALAQAHPGIFATAFPASHASLLAALESSEGRWPGDGVLWISKEGPKRLPSVP